MNKEDVKIGDIVCFEQCWEDEAGQYHDEFAEIVNITELGTLVLNWIAVPKNVKEFLDNCDFEIEDISYISEKR